MILKSSEIRIFLLLLIPTLSLAQQDEIAMISKQVREISSRIASYDSINSADKNQMILKLYDEEYNELVSEGEGELNGYFVDGGLRRLHHQSLTFSGFIDMYFFFRDGELICAHHVERKLIGKYDDGDWIAWDLSKTPDTIFVGKYYVKGKELIDLSAKGEPYFSSSLAIEDLLTTSDLLTEILEEKIKK